MLDAKPIDAAGPSPLPDIRAEAARKDRWSGIALVALMLAAAALVGQRVLDVATGPRPPGPGVPAPALAASTLDGEPLDLAGLTDRADKVVLVDFWATWCPPCVAAMPTLERLHRDYGDRGFAVLGVNQEPGQTERVRRFMERRGLSFPTLIDPGGLSRAWGVYTYPTSFLIGRDGMIREVYRGPASASRLRRDIEAALDPS